MTTSDQKNKCSVCKSTHLENAAAVSGLMNRMSVDDEIFLEIDKMLPPERRATTHICQECDQRLNHDPNRTVFMLRIILAECAAVWQVHPEISWTQCYETGEKLLAWKQREQVPPIWDSPPSLLTATLDDGIGKGLKMIHLYSEIAGVNLIPLGMVLPPEAVIEACFKHQPDLLGLTVLQFDSEEEVVEITERIPETVEVIAGGPIFKMIPKYELAEKRYRVLNSVGAYIEFLLDY